MVSVRIYKFVSKQLGFLIFLIGLSIFIGWFFNNSILDQFYFKNYVMKPGSSISFILSGICLWLLNSSAQTKFRIPIINASAVIILIISGLTLFTSSLKLEFGIDSLFKSISQIKKINSIGMAPASSVNFLIIGFSILFSHKLNNNALRILIALIIPISLFAFLNHFIDSQSLLYPDNFTPISLLSSVSFLLVAVGYIFYLSGNNTKLLGSNFSRYKNAWSPLLLTIILIALASLLRIWPLHSLGARTMWVTFYPAVTLVAIYGGFGPGLFATFLSCFVILFLWPIFVAVPFIKDNSDWLSMAIFIITCGIISYIAEVALRSKEKIKLINKQLSVVNSEYEKEIESRQAAEKEIKQLNQELESKVLKRTEELEQTNNILRKSEERFRSTLDNMLEGCQIIGFNWRYIYLNDSADKHNRRHKDELLGNRYTDMWPGIDQLEIYRIIKKTMDDRITQHIENEFEFPDGSKGWFELSIQPVPEGIFILSYDISDRKKSEVELHNLNLELEQRIKQRTAELETVNKELEAFSYSVSHDLRAPLRHINGFVKLLHDSNTANMDAKSKRYLNIITDSANEMGILIDGLLNFSKMGRASLKYSIIDFNFLVGNVIREIKDSLDKINIEWNLCQLPSLSADSSLMRVVFVNLINNAVKYTRKASSPIIEIGSFSNPENKMVFYVKDNGAGFDMKYAHKLFGVFQRLHSAEEYEGTGIGLATVRRIVHKHGGETWAEGEINNGATFYFSLPLVSH